MTLSRTSSSASLEAKSVDDLSNNDALSTNSSGSLGALGSTKAVGSISPKGASQAQDLKSPAAPQSPRRIALERLTTQLSVAQEKAASARGGCISSESTSDAPSAINENLQALMGLRLAGQVESTSALADRLIADIQPVNRSSARTSHVSAQQQNQMRAGSALNRLAAAKAKAIAMRASFDTQVQTPESKESAKEG